jgi:hypothetical protein
MIKNFEKIYNLKKNLYFFDKKLQFTYPKDSIKDVQATREVFILKSEHPELQI